ncbi:hypothetical protein CBR_g48835 [Chara braunii]|uniref:Reverse transcriptase/retrotransposon-derived protein RNase H-like domain-containing protein n=1 Tax=Chara braunii TaxID=69332 RepID=A0A388M3L0_CHABU|nr:hypothetical protein CBR_g48835 [Chara braunii]|eukprot:GBG89126.1 hypothetical protein CBR_g48835 [Chara braunii]
MSVGQGGRAREPFRAVEGDEREEVLLKHDIWQWVDRGQKNVGRANGSWRMRCRLCSKELDGAVNRAVNHFIQPSDGARCKHANGEILCAIYKAEGKSKIPQKLFGRLDAHMRELGYPSSTPIGMGVGEDGCEEDPSGDVPLEEGSRLEPTPAGDGAAADLPLRPPRSNASRQQSSMTIYLVDELQREMNYEVAQFFYENAIAFNAARSDAYKKIEKVAGDATRAKKVLTLLSYDLLRTDELQGSYKKTDTDMDEIRSTWPKTGYTLMTDGTTTTSNRPVINFLAGGDKGAVMVKSMDMEGKDKSAPTLAKMWEGVIRELGVKNINTICTNSAQVNISARNILAKHPDPEIRQIPWQRVGCGPMGEKQDRTARACRELVHSVEWWRTVDEAVKLLEPAYKFMRTIDSNDRMGPHIWNLAVSLKNRMKSAPMDDDTRKVVMQKVKQHMEMMALPVHAATHMLHPASRSADLFDNLEAPLIHNTLAHIATIYPAGMQAYIECWDSLLSFHQRDPEWTGENSEEYLSSKRISMAQWWMTYGYVNTEWLDWETPEDVAPHDGFMQDGEYDPEDMARRAANWSRADSRLSKATMLYVHHILDEVEDDGAWLAAQTYTPPLKADRARVVEDVSADSDDEEEEDEIADLPLQCSRVRMTVSRREQGDDNLVGGVTATPATRVDGSAVGGARSCVTTFIGYHASAAVAIGGRSALQRSTCVGGTGSAADHVHGSTVVGGSSTVHNSSFGVACSLAIGGSSIVDGGVAVGVTVSDTGAGYPADAADVPAGKANADLDVDMSDTGGECREDTTTIPPATDVFASLINFISSEDYTISPLSSPLQTDSEDSNPPRERLSNAGKAEASEVKPQIPLDPLEVELQAQEEKLRQQGQAVETLKAELKKKEEATQKEARKKLLIADVEKIRTSGISSQYNKDMAEFILLQDDIHCSYFTNWSDRITNLESSHSTFSKKMDDISAKLDLIFTHLKIPTISPAPPSPGPSHGKPASPPHSRPTSPPPTPTSIAASQPSAPFEFQRPKLTPPPMFSGEDPKVDVADWFAAQRTYLSGFKCDEDVKVSAILARLERSALKWCTSTSNKQGMEMADWAQRLGVAGFLQALPDRFADKEQARKAADKILRLGQKKFDGSLSKLYSTFESLTSTPGLEMSEQDLLIHFLRAAPEQFQLALFSHSHKDRRSFGRAALDLESELHVQEAPSEGRDPPLKGEGGGRVPYLLLQLLVQIGLAPKATKVAAVQEWSRPANISDVQSFLGLASYYRKFIKNFSSIVSPLTDLTKKDTSFLWTSECQEAFTRLKEALICDPVLKLPDPTLPFVLTTDTSQYGVGAVLQQDDGNGLQPIEYMSKKIKTKKLQDSTYEKELYALVSALKHWKHFLLGRHFKIFSDHSTLQWMKPQGELNDKLARYIQFIDMFDFELRHKKGYYNRVADALSRRPDALFLISFTHSFGERTRQTIAMLLPQD